MGRHIVRTAIAVCSTAWILSACAADDGGVDIINILASDDDFSILVGVVQEAGLVGILKKEGPFTLFAPTNAAFAKLPADRVEHLVQAESHEDLVSILLGHVVPGLITADQLAQTQISLGTLEGSALRVHAGEGSLMVEGTTITSVDRIANNGVVHGIDRVILPKNH